MSKHKLDTKLSELDYLQIELSLNDGYLPADIGRMINRDPSGIRKEISLYGVWIEGSIRKCSRCIHYRDCAMHYMCKNLRTRSICSVCRHCSTAPTICPYYEVTCDCKTLTKRHICNGCENIHSCRTTYRYIAKYAILQHTALMYYTHRHLKIDSFPSEFLDYLSLLLKNGISPDIIMHTLPPEFTPLQIAVSTFYTYIDKNLIPGVDNYALRYKVSRAAKGHSRSRRYPKPIKHQLNGHSIEDLSEDDKSYPLGYIEIDTVIGIAGKAVLFTMLIPRYSLMITRKIQSKTQEEVKRVLDELESSLGEYFYLLFRTVVPDNGTEFTNSEMLEQSAVYEGQSRSHVYYTHSYSSWEKPHVENMHILLRWLVEKGADISKLTDDDVIEIILRLNNLPRPTKGYKTPIQLMEEELGPEIIEKLGLKKIPLSELNMHLILKK